MLWIAACVGAAAVASFGMAAVYDGGREAKEAAPLQAVSVESRKLVFRHQDNGTLLIYDAASAASSGVPIASILIEKNQFLATTVRLMIQERVRRQAGTGNDPFTLTRWSDGRLSFSDPLTNQTIELMAFGHTNVESFARLLREGKSS
jgi:putative photosynthetic complex assembly protein